LHADRSETERGAASRKLSLDVIANGRIRGARSVGRLEQISYFAQAEDHMLFAACEAAYPRWLAFIGCCTLAGLR
jgi:hypothetical protein